MMLGMSNHLSIVSRFHYHCQKVIGPLGLQIVDMSVLKMGFCSSIIVLSALNMMVVFVQRLFLVIRWHRELCVGSKESLFLSFACS